MLRVSSLNFNLKSVNDRRDIIENFGKFVNSITYPVQILCVSDPIDCNEWLLGNQDVEYREFLRELVKDKTIMTKTFYVAFTGNDDIELREIGENIEGQLRACGLISEEVSPHEPHSLPHPRPHYVMIDGLYYKTFFVSNWPHRVVEGWLEDLYTINRNVDLSMFIHPVDRDRAIDFLTRKIAQLRSSVIIKEDEYQDNDDREEAPIASAEMMRDELYKNEGNFFNVNLYITVKSKDLNELRSDVNYVRRKLRGLMIDIRETILRHDDGLRCSLPHGIDYLRSTASYTLTTTPLKRFFPFVSTNVVDRDGILIGKNLLNGSLIFVNHFQYLTAGMIVLGKSGSGKSYAVKAQVIRLHDRGVEVTVLDREGEFTKLTAYHPGLTVKGFKTDGEYEDFLRTYWKRVRDDPDKPRFLVIDEFWEFMRNGNTADIVQEIVKRGRKRWLGLCVITQEVEDLLTKEQGRSVINNCSLKMLLKIESNQREAMRHVFDLTDRELSFLIRAERGEGILFAGTNHVQFKTLVPESQHRLITTDPKDRWWR